MAESYIQLPADSTGKKLRTRQRSIGGNTVEEQYVVAGALPTFYAYFAPTISASNKVIAAIWNGNATEVVKLRKGFLIQSTAAAVTGVQVQFDAIRRSTSHSGGTTVTPVAVDTADTLPSSITCASGGPTAGTSAATYFSYFTNNDENLLGSTTNQTLLQMNSIIPEGPEIKEITLRPSQGFTITHVTNSTITSWGFLMVFTVGE